MISDLITTDSIYKFVDDVTMSDIISLHPNDAAKNTTASTTVVLTDTSRNATDLLHVADFTRLLQVVNKLQQACWRHLAASLLKSDFDANAIWENQACTKLLFADLIQVVSSTNLEIW